MRPICLKLVATSLDDAEASLERHLPWLDVSLFEFRAGTALMPPHLLGALEAQHGARAALSILKSCGLASGGPVTWREAFDWALEHSDVWQHRPERADHQAPQGKELDWHLTLCKVPQAWATWGGPEHIDWGDVRVGHIDTGYTEHPAFGFPAAPWIDTAAGRSFIAEPPSACQ